MRATIGSLSHGTMRHEHLIPVFSDEIRRLAKHDRDSNRRRYAARVLGSDNADPDEQLHEMFEVLNAYAPPYAYFGSHEGDGSDYGYWPAIESLEDDANEGDTVVKVAAGDPWPEGLRSRGVSFVMEVNDHGNVSLRHACNGREAWSIV